MHATASVVVRIMQNWQLEKKLLTRGIFVVQSYENFSLIEESSFFDSGTNK
ncbi:MAG: hypothetical protein LUD48_05110 [Prevotella sp.]|nr:hypothetical protein [Prevotella sp.]